MADVLKPEKLLRRLWNVARFSEPDKAGLDCLSVVWDYVARLVLPINPGSQEIADAIIIDIVPHVDTSIGEIHYCQVKFMLDSSQHFPLNRPCARILLDDIKDRRHCGWQRQVCHRAFLPKVGPQFGKSGNEGWGTADFVVFAGHHRFFLAGI